MTKSGSGVWVLPTANSYEGGTQISAGHLAIRNSTALGAAAGAVNVAAGAQLAFSAHGLTVANPITLNGITNYVWSGNTLNGALVGDNLAGPAAIRSPANSPWPPRAIQHVGTDKSLSISGLITGAGGLQQDLYSTGNGGPLVHLNRTASANSYGLGTTVNAGILSLGTGGTGGDTSHAGALGTGPVTINTGAQVRLWIRNNAAFTIANNFALNGGTVHDEDGNYTMTGTFTLGSGGGTLSANYTGKDSDRLGAGHRRKRAHHSEREHGLRRCRRPVEYGNNYSGNTTVTNSLRLGASGVIPSGAGTGNVTVNGNLNLNGFSETINGLNGSGTVTSDVAGTPTLTLGGGDAGGNFRV